MSSYQLNPQEFARVQVQLQSVQPASKPTIWYRFFVENQVECYQCEENKTTWFDVCGAIEQMKMKQFYKRNQGNIYSGIDVGGLVAVFESQLVTQPSNNKQDERHNWVKNNMLSPFYRFGQTSEVLVLIRIPRFTRLTWYNEKFGSKWFYRLASSLSDAKVDADSDASMMMTEDQKIEHMMNQAVVVTNNRASAFRDSWFMVGTLEKRPAIKEKTFIPIRARRNNEPDRQLAVKNVLPGFITGTFRSMYMPINHYINRLTDSMLMEMTVYDSDQVEFIRTQDLELHGLIQKSF